MRKIKLLLASAVLIISCDKTAKEIKNTEIMRDDIAVKEKTIETTENFNIEDIPFSNADLGDFPFFTLPKTLVAGKSPMQKKFDVCFFPINAVMTPFEGQLYKANIGAERGEEFSQHYFEKSMADYLTSIGAVKIFDGEITKEEYERYNKQDPNKGGTGDIGYWDEPIKFYVIRSQEKGNIYVQYSSNNAGAKLNILQEETFVQTMTKVSADDIAKDLSEKGKSVLYINFETDKAHLSTEGQDVVKQISEALKNNTSLKIAIEGHTDNTGDATRNKKLSEDRANAVLTNLIKQGIEESRLSAKGFGTEKPLVANDSESNKAKNRRVELIKID